MRPPRVLHVPHNVGSNPYGLARAERELGLDSWCVTLTQNFRDYPADEVLLHGDESWPVREAKRWRLVGRAATRYDIVHFNSGQSIFPVLDRTAAGGERGSFAQSLRHGYARLLNMRDLRLLKALHRGVVVTYQGDDARLGGSWGTPGSPFTFPLADEAEYYTLEWDEARRQMIDRVARSADRIYYLNPDLAHTLPAWAEFMPYGHVDMRVWAPVPYELAPDEPPLVLHAPWHKGVKGTRFVLDAVERLRTEGVPFRFELVEGLPHHEARALFERAHILVDQLLLGWYGGLAVELMALGKPVIAHVRASDLGVLPPEMRAELPVIDATHETVYDVLRECLTTRRHELPELGRRSRAYVEHWHDPLRIAARLKDAYQEIIGR